jgi:hypothetical protein
LAVDEVLTAQRASQLLQTSYPDGRQREHAMRWLGWMAWHMGDSLRMNLRSVPSWVPRRWLGLARWLAVLPVWGVLAGLGYVSVPRWPGTVIPLAIVAWLLPWSLHDPSPATWLTEFVLLVQWRERVRVRRLVADAVERGVMRRAGHGYQFTDPSAQAVLAANHQADLDARARQRAAQAARAGARSALIAFLTDRRIALGVGAGIGAGIYGLIEFLVYNAWNADSTLTPVGRAFCGISVGMLGAIAAFAVLALVTGLARWTLANVPSLSRRQHLVVTLAFAAAAVAIIATAGTALAPAGAYVLPAAFVAVCGLWACWFVFRQVRKVRTVGRPLLRWLLTLVPGAIGVATVAATLLLLTERDLLTAEPAAGFLFPVAVWGSVKAWLAMRHSGRTAVRAGADVTLSLLLGAELVLFLVWLANLLRMSRPEVAALRVILRHAGAAAALPWWSWTVLYATLAAASVGFVLRPGPTAAARRWLRRLRVVPAVNAARRVLSGVHIGLLAIVLVGLTAPAALVPTFQRQLAASYTVALQRQFEAEGELAAYTQIRREFTSGTASPTLVQIVTEIHDDSPPPPGDDNATSTEDAIAQRVGALQAATLNLAHARALLDTAEAATRQAGLDTPVRSESDLATRLGQADTQDQNEQEADSSTTQAGELAASALASTISIANVGGHETFQIIEEYLSGLVEESSLKDAFAGWAQRLPGAEAPPQADTMVTPDPVKLKNAAYDELAREFTAAGHARELSEDQAVSKAMSEPPAEAAVSLASQSLQDSSGSCAACTAPGGSGGSGDDDAPPPPDDGE